MYTEEVNKVALSPKDDKRVIMEDGIHTLAYGHYRLKTEGARGFIGFDISVPTESIHSIDLIKVKERIVLHETTGCHTALSTTPTVPGRYSIYRPRKD